MERTISLQLNRRRLAGRGLERRPLAPRGRPAGPTRGTPEECSDAVLTCIYEVKTAVEMTLTYLLNKRKRSNNFFRIPRGETRWGDRGPLKAVAAPLTPRPRGTIYETMPFALGRV